MRFAAVIFCFLCTFLSSCSQSSTTAKNIRLNLVSEPTSIDPILCRNLSSLFLARELHEGLFRYEGENVLAALADRFEVSQDGLVYKIYIKDAFYSDGSSITAYDFVDTMKRALDKNTICDYAHLTYVIRNAKDLKQGLKTVQELGVSALDDKTLVYTLAHPYPEFIALLTHPVFFPAKYKEGKLLFSGPFVVGKKMPNSHIELKKNHFFHDKQSVLLDSLTGLFINNETASLMFQKQEIDFIGSPLGSIPQDCLDDFSQKQFLYFHEMLATCFLRINTSKQGLNSVSNRQQINQAISRKEIVENALAKRHLETNKLVPTCLQLDSSISFLEMVNFSLLSQKNLTLKYSSSDARMQKVACLIKQNLEQKLGLKIHLLPKEMKMLVQDLSLGDYDLMLGSWIADLKDPENFLELFKYKNQSINGTFWENVEFQKYLELAQTDPEKRRIYLQLAQNILLNESPIIPLFQYNMIYAKDKKLEGFSLNSLGILDFKKAFIK